MTKGIVIGDADSLIALLLENDANNKRAQNTLTKLNEWETAIVYPNTAIAEAITTLLRKYSNPELAGYLTRQYKENIFRVEYVDEGVMRMAADLFNPKSSKQNTFFDAIVAATAKSLNADAIFSFDRWYEKVGFKLTADLG